MSGLARALGSGAAAVVALALAGCLWSETVNETKPSQPAVPSPGGGRTATPGTAAAPGAPTGPGVTTATPPSAPIDTDPLPRPAYLPPRPAPADIHGLLVLVPETPLASAAGEGTLLLTFAAGRRGGPAGLAELSAHVLADERVPELPAGSLRRSLARLGAALDLEVTADVTRLHVSFPAAHWREVTALLGERLAMAADPVAGRGEVERVRGDLTAARARELLADPMSLLVDRLLGRQDLGAAAYLAELRLRTAGEVAAYRRARYRAAGAVLALAVPEVTTADLVIGVQAAVLPWIDLAVPKWSNAAGGNAVLARELLWAPREGAAEVALVLARPHPAQDLAAELLVLEQCLTMGGLGGRLGAALEAVAAREVPFSARPDAIGGHLVLRARCWPELLEPVREAATKAQASFTVRPPSAAELGEAAARARLQLLAAVADPRGWALAATAMARHNARPDALGDVLARLESPERLRIGEAIGAFTAQVVAMAALGGQPDTEAGPPVALLDPRELPAPDRRLAPTLDPARSEQAATVHLEHAVKALGGRPTLTSVAGYVATATLTAEVGPDVELRARFDAAARELRETREVLATTIDTVITGDNGRERSGSDSISLPVDEVQARLARAAHHPLMLLAAWCRGEIRFRLIALRLDADRELAVLEQLAADGSSPASSELRIAIDTGSGLPRTVESRQWRGELGTVAVVEQWGDYRQCALGTRAPFLCVRRTDPGSGEVTLRYAGFDPVAH